MAAAAAVRAASTSSAAAAPESGRRGRAASASVDLKGTASMAAMKKGPGYRSSFSGMVATVFGASGAVGRGVCNRLGQNGSQLILPYRGDHIRYMRFKPYGDLGQVLFTPYNLRDEESIRTAIRHSNVVINLVGREYKTRNFDFKDVNVEGPRRLARLAREAGVQNFVHVSHINAREEPERLFTQRGSEFLRTKWLGEQAVLEEFPDATIFRPTLMYGMADVFIHHIFEWPRYGFGGRLPLWKKGEQTVVAPLHLSDLASGIFNSLSIPDAKGTVYEAYGPHKYLQSEIVDWMHEITQRDPRDWGYKRTDLRLSPLVFAKTFAVEKLPIGNQWLGTHTVERLERLCLSDDILGLPNLADLGVDPAPVTEKMPFETHVKRAFGYYYPEVEEMPAIADPVPLENFEARKAIRESKVTLTQQLGLEG